MAFLAKHRQMNLSAEKSGASPESSGDEQDNSAFMMNNSDGAIDANRDRRTRRKTSDVWNFFTLQPPQPGVREQIAICNYCGHTVKYISSSGTGGLRAHSIRCTQIIGAGLNPSGGDADGNPSTEEKKVKSASKSSTSARKRPSSSLYLGASTLAGSSGNTADGGKIGGFVVLEHGKLSEAITELVVSNNLDFKFPQTTGFKKFLKTLSGSVEFLDQLPSPETIENDVNHLYEQVNNSIRGAVEAITASNTKISVLVNLWSTSRSHKIMTVGIQYVSNQWELAKYLIAVKIIDEAILNAPAKLSQQVIEALDSFRLSSQVIYAVFDAECHALRLDTAFWHAMKAKNPHQRFLFGNGASSLEHLSADFSYSVIFTAIAKELLQLLSKESPILTKIHEHLSRFNINLVQRETIDHKDNWKSTVEMIHYVILQKTVISNYPQRDSSLTPLTNEEWKVFEAVDKVLVKITASLEQLTKPEIPVAHLLYPNIHDIGNELTSSMKLLMNMSSIGAVNKSWENTAERILNTFHAKTEPLMSYYAIGLILDASCKAEYIIDAEHANKADFYTNKMKEWFAAEYSASSGNGGNTGQDPAAQHSATSSSVSSSFIAPAKDNWTIDSKENFYKRRKVLSQQDSSSSSSSGVPVTEIDIYLKESLQIEGPSFEILSWWKLHFPRFPLLSKMARDLLGVPISAVHGNLVYSTSLVNQLDDPTGNLPFNLMKKVLCTRSWFQNGK